MDVGLQKTIVFLFFIFLGILLKSKFKSKEELGGIKKIILNLALPATIFIALLGIEIELSLLVLPLLAIGLNLFLFFLAPIIFSLLGLTKGTPIYRTARLLVPSLAPGLSCFPFVLEFLGDSYLAKAAMADLGNKVFVLIFLYIIAMNWHYSLQSSKVKSGFAKLGKLIKAMVSEPVNLFIAAALILLGLGLNMDSLPFVFSETLNKLSLIMTPLVLLFIGLAVKIKRKQLLQIFSLLCLRAGLVFIVSGITIYVSGIQGQNDILLLLAFGLSACSFWPYAHIAAVDSLESDTDTKTFDGGYAINILALSFPLSTVLILGVLNSGSFFSLTPNIFLISAVLCSLGLLSPIYSRLKKSPSRRRLKNRELEAAVTEHA